MNSFRYEALQGNGATVRGTIEAEDRRIALRLLGQRGLFPSSLEDCGKQATASNGSASHAPMSSPAGSTSLETEARRNGSPAAATTASTTVPPVRSSGFRFGARVRRKDITAFTGEMAALLEAAIPIPQALSSLSEEEQNPAMKSVLQQIAESVRKGHSLSAALGEHPRLFSKLYISMVRVGEEAGALPKVMLDLAALLEHDDEVRGEVLAAVSYPVFVLAFGVFTVALLLTVVLPRLFSMFQDMMQVLPWPTLLLMKVSGAFNRHWLVILLGVIVAAAGFRYWSRSARGVAVWDGFKLKIPVLGSVFMAAALSRFARTLGTLVRSGVSLLPALKIVENTIGNFVLGRAIAQVAEETRGGDSLAAPLRKLGLFPRSVVQMISVGEETGKLDQMLLKVADIEERHMRARTKTLVSLLAPALILVVGAMVGFVVIAILLPILKMSQAFR